MHLSGALGSHLRQFPRQLVAAFRVETSGVTWEQDRKMSMHRI